MKRPISRHLVSTHPSSSSGLATEGTIACAICQAVYAPSRFHAHLLQTPSIALESAFMSMCHFCYRCRRASCPNCWDHIHNVCAQCTQETHLPFRTTTPPLEGIPSLPQHINSSMQQHSVPSSLVRVQPGRFQSTPTAFVESSRDQPDPHFSKPQAQSSAPKSVQTLVISSPVDIERIKSRPDRSSSRNIDEIATRPDSRSPLDLDKIATRPDRRRPVSIDNIASSTRHPVTGKTKRARLFIVLALFLLLLSATVIVAALLSVAVNLFLYNTLHIDIQAAVTTFWHWLLNLF
jgi:hypothetical protein